jgi:prevent-host-death family protein
MIQIPLSEAKDQLSRLLTQATEDDVVLTSDGRPVGVLIGFADEDDWFDYQLQRDPRFIERIKSARAEVAAGKVVRLEDLTN